MTSLPVLGSELLKSCVPKLLARLKVEVELEAAVDALEIFEGEARMKQQEVKKLLKQEVVMSGGDFQGLPKQQAMGWTPVLQSFRWESFPALPADAQD